MKKSRIIFPFICAVFIFFVILNVYNNILFKKALISESIKQIHLNRNGNEVTLSNIETIKFLDELRPPSLIGHHSHPLEHRVEVTFIFNDGSHYSFFIDPDSDIEGYYWIYSKIIFGSVVPYKNIYSMWLFNLLKHDELDK